MNGFYKVPKAINEPICMYAPNTKERALLEEELQFNYKNYVKVPMYIGNQEIVTENKKIISPPHNHKKIIGEFYHGTKEHAKLAIEEALKAKHNWENLSWEQRAAIFLKAGHLAATKYRYKLNAATMMAQSKNPYQAEIDAACELIDFLRFNVQYMTEIYSQQPESLPGVWNRLEYRPLEGFVVAITPFNFTAIAMNLPCAPALMGNVVVWKPSDAQVYSAKVIMDILFEAGLPKGVINLVTMEGEDFGDVVFNHKEFSGLHFTGSTKVFQHLWQTIGANISKYKSYPRIVGETGGKDFIFAHNTCNINTLVGNIIRGAFEYQGQKCSAASRAYIPNSIWPAVKQQLVQELQTLKIGETEQLDNFINAVINEASFDKITRYIEQAKLSNECEIISGGTYDKSEGYFITPTVIITSNPKYTTMCDELFGPVITIFVYDDTKIDETLELVDTTSEYALTGAILSSDRYFIESAITKLKHAAGNLYINDKPTGAIVGQQPFGGARASGTNDKAGSMLNLLRWVSPLTIKETLVPIENYRY
jgi:1-pyrroline-5-carboxylate dehydrogenase